MNPISEEKRIEVLEACFQCFCENGLENTSTKKLSDACHMSTGNLFNYFDNKDEIIIKSTAYCMEKVEAQFLERAPKSMDELAQFLKETPYWTAKEHGAKYRFMYQVYTSPRYRQCGVEYVERVTVRHTEYARILAPKLGLPPEIMTPMVFAFVRACMHYTLFENEEYLRTQMDFLLLNAKMLQGYAEDALSPKINLYAMQMVDANQ